MVFVLSVVLVWRLGHSTILLGLLGTPLVFLFRSLFLRWLDLILPRFSLFAGDRFYAVSHPQPSPHVDRDYAHWPLRSQQLFVRGLRRLRLCFRRFLPQRCVYVSAVTFTFESFCLSWLSLRCCVSALVSAGSSVHCTGQYDVTYSPLPHFICFVCFQFTSLLREEKKRVRGEKERESDREFFSSFRMEYLQGCRWYNDFWRFNARTRTWSVITSVNQPPHPRSEHSAAVLGRARFSSSRFESLVYLVCISTLLDVSINPVHHFHPRCLLMFQETRCTSSAARSTWVRVWTALWIMSHRITCSTTISLQMNGPVSTPLSYLRPVKIRPPCSSATKCNSDCSFNVRLSDTLQTR